MGPPHHISFFYPRIYCFHSAVLLFWENLPRILLSYEELQSEILFINFNITLHSRVLPSVFCIRLLILLIIVRHIPLSILSLCYYEQKIKSFAFIQLCPRNTNKKTTKTVFCTSLKGNAILDTIIKKKKKEPKGDATDALFHYLIIL